MKTQKLSAVNKLITRFDQELKNIIMGDLNALKSKTALINNISNSLNSRLKAA